MKNEIATLAALARAQTDMIETLMSEKEDTPFTVSAGKYDGGQRNCKYVESFRTLDYPWYEIEYGCDALHVEL